MQRGNLVIYDTTGKIYAQTGEADGDISPHEYPNGIPFIEIPFGTMESKRLIAIDVIKVPHEPIFEDIVTPKTAEQLRIEELENEILLMADESAGGIL